MKYIAVEFNIKPVNKAAFALQDARDLIAALTGEIGFESFEDTDQGLVGYIQLKDYNDTELKNVVDGIPLLNASITYVAKEAEDRDWNSEWEEKGYEPIVVNDRCIIHDTKHPAPHRFDIDITIDARLAFGTGTHQTTRMIVTRLLGMDLEGKRVLDCGCGTGILSIVALKCGAGEATGYDIDEWSVENAIHNAEINGTDHFRALLGDASVIGNKMTGTFDVVIANINRNILQADMSDFVSVMGDRSILILSGFYIEDAPILIQQANTFGLQPVEQVSDDNWCCIELKK